MPLMLLNLRALPNGLESHKGFLKSELDSWLAGGLDEADVTFICTGVEKTGKAGKTVRLAAHQAVLAPVSEVLREMFIMQSCGHVRNMVTISLDCDPEVLQSILILIYNGKTYLSTTAVDKMKSIVRMLGLKFPGGFDRNELAKGFKPPVSSLFRVTSETRRPRPGPSSVTKRPRESSQGGLSGDGTPSPALKKTKPSPPAPVKVSATERMNLHISMTMKLSNCEPGKSIPCEIPGCGAMVSYDQLSSHFLNHENNATASQSGSPVSSFPCVACGVTFKSRGELDTHTKNRHGGGAVSVKEKLNLLSDSSDDDDSFDRVSETTSVKSPVRQTETRKEPQRCDKCDSLFPSFLHLKSHSCSGSPLVESIKCDTCFKAFKTNKALAVHRQNAHKGGSGDPDIKREKVSPNKKYQCQICTKRFMEFRQLRTHYTLYHFWDNLAEDYKDWGDTCNICQKKYPTEDHLVQHLGNFHCKIDYYLIKKGLRIITKEKTAKLRSLRCEICKAQQPSSAALKSHMSVKHFQRELLAEFPISRGKVKKCPKCFKLFDMSSVSTVVAHVGSFHDEVIKYGADYLELEVSDIENVPIDDFDDGTVGVPVTVSKLDSKGQARAPAKLSGKGVFDFRQCQMCHQDFHSSDSLKIHYIRHFQTNFQSQYFSRVCPHCDKSFPDILSNQKHVATDHTSQSLLPLMESHGLWVNKSVILDRGAMKTKRLVVGLKKLSKSAIRGHLEEIEQTKASKAPPSHKCEMPGCTKEYGNYEHLLTHLVINHFWKEISSDYQDAFTMDPKTCPVCKGSASLNGERMAFFKHIAVSHPAQSVLKYVTKANEAATDPRTTAIKLVNRMGPPPTLVSTITPSAFAPATASAAPTPVLRFSNESSEDEGHGAASNGSVIKTEAVERTETGTGGRNEDFINKIRNVFSDDSDSD